MRVAIGADHAGYEMKNLVGEVLRKLGHEVEDLGTHSSASVDYPDVAQKLAEAVSTGRFDRGVLVCGTGIGMAIAANKIPAVRAASCSDPFSARMARAHNDANVLTLGARVVGSGVAREVVEAFFGTAFEAGRHLRRVEKIHAPEGRHGAVGSASQERSNPSDA